MKTYEPALVVAATLSAALSFAPMALGEDAPFIRTLTERQAVTAEAMGTARGLFTACGSGAWDAEVALAFIQNGVGDAQPDTQAEFGRVFAFYSIRAGEAYAGEAACDALVEWFGDEGSRIPGLVSFD